MVMMKGSPRFDVVFMDLHMPVCDGWEAATILRSRLQGACPPIYALTASAQVLEEAKRNEEEREKEEGCYGGLFSGVIAKPYSLNQLKDALHHVKATTRH